MQSVMMPHNDRAVQVPVGLCCELELSIQDSPCALVKRGKRINDAPRNEMILVMLQWD